MYFYKTVIGRLFFAMAINKTLLESFMDVSAAFTFLPLLVSMICIKHMKGCYLSLFILFGIAVVTELMSGYLRRNGINNSPLFHLYTVVEFILISLFYYYYIKQSSENLWIKLLIIIFPFIGFVDYTLNGLYKMDIITSSLSSIIISSYALFVFYDLVKTPIYGNFLNQPIFWINSGVLFYFAGNLLIFLFSNYILKNYPGKHNLLWATFHSFFNINYNALVSIGIWKLKKA